MPRGFGASSPHHKMWVEASPATHCLHVAQQPQWAAAWAGVGLSKGRGEDQSWGRGLRINSKGDGHPEGIGLAPGQGVSPWGKG